MNRVMSVVFILIVVSLFLFIYIATRPPMDTPPPYRFYWELKIVEENNTGVILEVENISLFAYRGHKYVDITNETTVPLHSVIVWYNGKPVNYPFLHTPIKYMDLDNNDLLSKKDRILIENKGLE